uniref:Reverse transcriptase domain-containing protein n=1 Tax=Homalodisca liturata TaxID=320908 RepID=A0A1B6HQL6_9HEMI
MKVVGWDIKGYYNLYTWCLENRMKLNAKKWQVITFHRVQSPVVIIFIMFNYSLLGETSFRVSDERDIGILRTHSLSPDSHIQSMCMRAKRTLGFILRSTKHFGNVVVMKTLHCALVRQILEYGCPISSPHQGYICEEIESIQRRFACMMGIRIGFLYHEVTVEALSRELGLQPLEK